MISLLTRLKLTLKALAETWRQSANIDEDEYPFPEHGWLCFHCGERYTTTLAARVHFGERPTSIVGCKIDEHAYRDMETRLAATLAHNQRLVSHNMKQVRVCSGHHV